MYIYLNYMHIFVIIYYIHTMTSVLQDMTDVALEVKGGG
jgi:hypothetical protein